MKAEFKTSQKIHTKNLIIPKTAVNPIYQLKKHKNRKLIQFWIYKTEQTILCKWFCCSIEYNLFQIVNCVINHYLGGALGGDFISYGQKYLLLRVMYLPMVKSRAVLTGLKL